MLLRTKFIALNTDVSFRTLKVTEKDFAIIIHKEITKRTPVWIWIVSVLTGMILLFLLMLILYKSGFFTRKIKQELKQKKRETMTNQSGQLNEAFESTHEMT